MPLWLVAIIVVVAVTAGFALGFGLGYRAVPWPKQYLPGKQQLERNLERERQMAAASSGLTPQQVAAKLLEG